MFPEDFPPFSDWIKVTFRWTRPDGTNLFMTELFEPVEEITKKYIDDIKEWFLINHTFKEDSSLKVNLQKVRWTWSHLNNKD